MSAATNNEKTPNLLSATQNQNVNSPIYPTLPPPYTPQDPSAPQLPQAPLAPSAPPVDTKSEEPKPSDKLNTEDEEQGPIEFSPKPMQMTCPSCKAEVITRTERHPTLRTHACACCLFWLVWWPCICLPYCLPGCNNIDHFCPNCDSYIGGFKC